MRTVNKSLCVLFALVCGFTCAYSQLNVDGKTFIRYNRKHFNPHRGLFYALYGAPLVTVDPLGIGGKSTYGVSVGGRLNLWESRSPHNKFSGVKIHGLYIGGGYEYYPRQYNKLYGSFWLRIKTIMPIVARADAILAHGSGMAGISRRYGFGFEVKKMTILLCGEYHWYFSPMLGWHPLLESPYANQGAIHLLIPLYTRNSIER